MEEITVSVDTLRQWLEEQAPVRILDVRPASERAEWFIPGSAHVDAYDALKTNDPDALVGVDVPGEGPIVTVCGAGRTSLTAARQLRAQGVKAFSLEGGMKAWSLAWNTATVPLAGSRTTLLQVRRTGKGCLSYVVGSGQQAAVIDPVLDPEVYLQVARQHNWTITHVLETHIHADHLSRARQLAARSLATLYLPEQERVAYPFETVRDGDLLIIGDAVLKVFSTPGHTPESTSYLLDDQALFTGDTLFLAGVGRPDLEASRDEARERAHQLYHSLQRIMNLDTDLLILPGHTSEPVAFDREPLALPLSKVKKRARLLHVREEEFVSLLLEHLPPPPPNHHRIVELNEAGRTPEGDITDLEAGANRCAIQ